MHASQAQTTHPGYPCIQGGYPYYTAQECARSAPPHARKPGPDPDSVEECRNPDRLCGDGGVGARHAEDGGHGQEAPVHEDVPVGKEDVQKVVKSGVCHGFESHLNPHP